MISLVCYLVLCLSFFSIVTFVKEIRGRNVKIKTENKQNYVISIWKIRKLIIFWSLVIDLQVPSTQTAVITQHIGGDPSSLRSEAKDKPQHQNPDVARSRSQRQTRDQIHDVGHQEADPPAEPAGERLGAMEDQTGSAAFPALTCLQSLQTWSCWLGSPGWGWTGTCPAARHPHTPG